MLLWKVQVYQIAINYSTCLVLRWRMLYCQVYDEFVEQEGRCTLQSAATIGSVWQLLDDRTQRCKKDSCRVVPCKTTFECYALSHRQSVKFVFQGKCDVIILSHARGDAGSSMKHTLETIDRTVR